MTGEQLDRWLQSLLMALDDLQVSVDAACIALEMQTEILRHLAAYQMGVDPVQAIFGNLASDSVAAAADGGGKLDIPPWVNETRGGGADIEGA